jgi:hypothetical protein
MIPLIGAALVAVMVALCLEHHSERRAAQARAAKQEAQLGEVLEELVSLHSALVATGAAPRSAQLPPPAPSPAPRSPPALALPSVERKVVSVTRDDDPIHTRATIEAPAPSGWGESRQRLPEPPHADDAEPPSTKPSPSHAQLRVRASAESSTIFESKATVRARIEVAEDEREKARARGELPPLPPMAEDDNRPTGEVFGDDEQTRVFSKRPGDADAHIPGVSVRRKPTATVRPPPHAPPRPRSERPTLFGGMAGAEPRSPSSRAQMSTLASATNGEQGGDTA